MVTSAARGRVLRARVMALAGLALLFVLGAPLCAQVVDYDIVYVRQARYGDDTNTIWPEIFHPARIDPGADLMLLHPDGSEEVLVAGGNGAVTDPFVSFDAQWVYYSLFPDVRREMLNHQRSDLPYLGADIYRIHLATREIERLTHGEFTPNTGAGRWDESNPLDPPEEFNRLGYGILNLGPCPLPEGRVAFTSNRNGFEPPKGYTAPTLQLFVMDEDGKNVEAIAPMNISSALHPTILRDGRLMFSSHEDQGNRDRRQWGMWTIYPDGRVWAPLVSAFRATQAFHFGTQLSNGDVVVVDYYNLNNNGFGALCRMPIAPPPGVAPFYPADVDANPQIMQTVEEGYAWPYRMPFTPWGMHSLSRFTHGMDQAAPVGADETTRVGKFTHPSAAPANDLLVVWTPGPANNLNRPTTRPYYDGGLYIVPGAAPLDSPSELVEIKNDPNYNEAWPRAVVPYSAVHGVDEPDYIHWLPNDGSEHAELPAGTPFGLVGTSSFFKRESFPGYVTPWADWFDGLDAFNTYLNGQSGNWIWQGADAGKYDDSEIWAVRILSMEPNTHRSYGPNHGRHFSNHAGERLRILGEIPLRKVRADGTEILDAEGNPDTSFLAKIPADTPFTFQTLDRDGLALNMSQTWHQVRPGEMRADCGGCHAHSKRPLDFATTVAARPGYPVPNLAQITPVLTKNGSGEPTVRVDRSPAMNVEFYRDIRPLLMRSCVPCHTKTDADPPAALVFDDRTLVDGLPGDYARLAADSEARWGHPPLVSYGWRQTNASRYVRKFQSRRSLLTWKVFGRRLDGWTNDDHPTESVPGDPATLPPGAGIDQADLDFVGTIMPPPDSGVPPLSEDEKMQIARWIDLGCPIDLGFETGNDEYGWYLDDQRPCLTVSEPRPHRNRKPLTRIRFGMIDAYSEIDTYSLHVHASFPVRQRPVGAELRDLVQHLGEGRYEIVLDRPIHALREGTIVVSIRDHQGNTTRVERSFSIAAPPRPTKRASALPPVLPAGR